MKTIITAILATLLFVSFANAQVPEKFTYQAIVRGNNNQLAQLQEIGMQISILQGTATGTAVYVERHFPKTNENGLVSIEIGTGTIISGDFSTIDWSAGPYFLKTETDLKGGANYTISGTTQLLSVPYALYAKTAEKLKGGIIESDPVYGASPASNIKESDINNWDNKQGPMQAGSGIEFSKNKMGVTIVSEKKYNIGDFAFGGIVFWVDKTGQHGLVCSLKDQSKSAPWLIKTYLHSGAYNMGIYGGLENTSIIISVVLSQQEISLGIDFAAMIVRGGNTDEFSREEIDSAMTQQSNWYLPSIGELKILNGSKQIINTALLNNKGEAIDEQIYWSSTDQTLTQARCFDFQNNRTWFLDKLDKAQVRAICKF